MLLFSPAISSAQAVPALTIAAPTAITYHSAHISGTVNPEGEALSAPTTWSFELSNDGGSTWNPLPGAGAIEPPASEEAVPVAVAGEATELAPNTAYVLRLAATNEAGGPIFSVEEAFTTKSLAPAATTLPFVGPASSEAARLYATINPYNSATTYRFDYVTEAQFNHSGFSEPLSTPEAGAPAGNAPESVGADLTGLAPSTTYRFRVLATSPAGSAYGNAQSLTTAAAPPTTCPNEQLRSEDNSTALPDCRSYEMVTPAFKSGGPTGIDAISSDGSRIIIESTSVFAGAEGYADFESIYESVRTGSGWATAAINPPGSLYPTQEFTDANPDLGRSVWELRRPSQSLNATDLYRREADGSVVEIGPMLPPSATEGPPGGEFALFTRNFYLVYSGSSPDLSHVFFQIRDEGPLWRPSDTTVISGNAQLSLYEYVGTGNTEPQLVGVSDGHTVVNGETLPLGRLISDCGISLGSDERAAGGHNADTYNAISPDGETVFFTAVHASSCGASHAPEVDEVYARVGQGGLAQTVPISEPIHADCEACQTAIRANAEFQGASQDGSLAFFLTEQKLLPGDEGENLYAYDFNGPAGHKIFPISTSTGVKVPGVQGVARVSQDGTHVYFVAHGVLTESANAESKSPLKGADNLYLYEHDSAHPGGRLSFLATLSEGDSRDWEGTDNRPVQATPDGRFLVFSSRADLTFGDTSSVPQVFEYDAVREELVRVSVGEVGYEAGIQSGDSHASGIVAPTYSVTALAASPTRTLALSNDGSTVIFESAAGLVRTTQAAAEAGRPSVYRYRSHGPLANGQISALSTGNPSFRSLITGISASGRDAFLRTEEPVLASDGDTQRDVYDAHEGGGFPAAAATPICAGEGCQGTPAPTPSKAAPTTPGFDGPGNSEEKLCKKGFVRKHGKCVKKHAKKNHKFKSKRTASHKRGGVK